MATIMAIAALVLAAACAGPNPKASPTGATPSGSIGPSGSDTGSVGDIKHSTGARDVILRLEQGGGFVPMEYVATQAPTFTLYGNGVVVFQRAATGPLNPDVNGVVRLAPWRTASLDEARIQDLLAFALGLGGLATARDHYPASGVADAPDTIFTIRAGGIDKTVVVNALGIDTQAGADAAARAAFARLAARLQDLDAGGTITSDVYVPGRYRGVLTELQTTPGAKPWPWPGILPTDFTSGAGGAGGPAVPHRTMTADEVAALGLSDTEGGLNGLVLRGPDGRTYGFMLRPLLVDEDG